MDKPTSLYERVMALNQLDESWVSFFKQQALHAQISWYHASGLDMRPILILRALKDWPLTDHAKAESYRSIGTQLSSNLMVYSDNTPRMYNDLFRVWEAKHERIWDEKHQMVRTMFHHLKGRGVLSLDLLQSIVPIHIRTPTERAEAVKRFPTKRGRHARHEYDGFLLRFQRDLGLPFLTDSIMFFCLDDHIVADLLIDSEALVTCLFVNTSGYEGSSSLCDIVGEDPERRSKLLANVQYLFTDHFAYSKHTNKYFLMKDYHCMDCSSFEVSLLLTGREYLEFAKDFQIRANLESDDDVISRGKYTDEFCIAIRK